MATYRVLYNENPDFFAAPKSPVNLAGYKVVAEVEALDHECVFEAMNAVDGTELCCRLRVRSMSVGDLLQDVATGEILACAPCGWEKVQAAG